MAALLLIILWYNVNPARPHLQTSDLYTHLSVSRHLLRGDGFVTDITYPLSFAFDFARELPQPLIHRGPGYALLLTIPVAGVQDDPASAVERVRWLQLLFLGLMAWAGVSSFLGRRNIIAIGSWLVFLMMSPMLNFAVDWAFSELPAALILLMLWLRNRDIPSPGPGMVDGLLAGALALLRWDLMWLPLVWWFWGRSERQTIARRNNPASTMAPSFWNRRLMLALMMVVAVNMPWLVRNVLLTESPIFTLQGQAELVKDTRTWPEYSVYRQLEPQPVLKVLAEDPVPVMRKFVRGLKFYFRELGRLFPWAGLVVMGLALMVFLRGGIDKSPCPLRPDAEHPMSIDPGESPLGPLVVMGVTLILMIVQYSFFDHSLRHLFVLYPLMAWEFAGLLGTGLRKLSDGKGINQWMLVGPMVVVTVILIKVSLQPLPGWNFSAQQARQQTAVLENQVQSLLDDPDPVPFVKSSAAPWYADRAAVWDPRDEEVRGAVRGMLLKR